MDGNEYTRCFDLGCISSIIEEYADEIIVFGRKLSEYDWKIMMYEHPDGIPICDYGLVSDKPIGYEKQWVYLRIRDPVKDSIITDYSLIKIMVNYRKVFDALINSCIRSLT